MSSEPRRIPFRVDINGVIEILGSALYNRPESALRELIQNAHDAIVRRRLGDLTYGGRIHVVQDGARHLVRIEDDGIGLTADEAERYLSTLGIGMTGQIRGRRDLAAPDHPPSSNESLIGMFGVGLFSAFMLAERLVIESRRSPDTAAIRWEAGSGPDVLLGPSDRAAVGTTVTLHLKPAHHRLATDPDRLEAIIKEFADFIAVPIHLNDAPARVNLIHPAWFEPTPDPEALELELATYFDETPLDVIPIRHGGPSPVVGALYVTSRRTPGFAGEAIATATVRRMVVSRQIQGLLPTWAPFLRGVLELNGCTPTLSREDLVRDAGFFAARATIEAQIFQHLERLAVQDRVRLDAILTWHAYTLAGAALAERRLRDLLRSTYRLPTSQGLLTFDEIHARSAADPLFETEADRVIWFNPDRRQEGWANGLFAGQDVPCVHTLRSFEEALLMAMAADTAEGPRGETVAVRVASPGSPGFAAAILGVTDLDDAPEPWAEFLGGGARVLCASFRADRPVLAFLNERAELLRTIADLRDQGTIPTGFQRLIDAHLGANPAGRNEVVLNRNHRLVARALGRSTAEPIASALRLLVGQALAVAGATPSPAALRQQADDLDWIADALWGRDP